MNTQQIAVTALATPPAEIPDKPSSNGSGVAALNANRLPRQARDGLMRVWLELLREQHPGVTWVAVSEQTEAAR